MASAVTLAFAIVATWIITLVVSALIGLPLARLVARSGPEVLRIAMWIGLAILTLLIMTFALFSPLKRPEFGAGLVILALLIGGITLWRTRIQWFRIGWTSQPTWVALALFAFALLILSVGATLAPTHYDFALYHYSGLSWAAQYGTVPGLANLIDYLGYSNSATPWSAALTNGPAGARGYAAFSGVWAVALMVDGVLRLLSADGHRRPSTYISVVNIVVLLGPLLIFADLFVASPTSDTAVFALLLVSGAALADGVTSPRLRAGAIVSTVIPLLIATSMRPQILLVSGLSSLVLLVLAFRNRRSPRQAGLTLAVVVTSLVGLALGILSLLRDYRLSGWAIYPLSVLPFDVSWRVEDPSALRAITIGIARDPGPGYQNAAEGYEWLLPWVGRQLERWEVFVFLALVATAGGLAIVALRRGAALRLRSLMLTAFPFVAFIVVWVILLPPTWRHSWGAVFGLSSLLLGWFAWRLRVPLRMWATGAGILVFALALAALAFRFPTKPTVLEPAVLNTVLTESGIELLQPAGVDDRCGIAPLLCTPMPRADLRFLGTDLHSGFTRDLW